MNTVLQNFNLLINGKIASAKTGKYFDAINPSTGEVMAKIADASSEDINHAVVLAKKAFELSRLSDHWSVEHRAKALKAVADLIREYAKELAELESLDTGKTLKQTTFIDIPTAADTFEYFSKQTSILHAEEIKIDSPCRYMTYREPWGVVGAIIPWNYPLIMAAWKVAPALLSGNSVILKPSPLASVSLMRLAQLIHQTGLFDGMLSVITSSRPQAGEELCRHPDVNMISFSGSLKTGQSVMQASAVSPKKVVLELGGKSPNIVFADADFDAALGGTLSSIFMNQGQMCTAGSRLLVEDKIYDRFVSQLVERAQSLKIGNALDFQTEFGPLISREHRDNLMNGVNRAQKDGAIILCGGEIPEVSPTEANGFYIEPTILGNITNDMWIAQEEVFGPVLSVIKFSNEDEVLQIANDSKYGLAAIVWTKNLEKANRVSRQINCGTVWINTYGAFHDAVSFGGWKSSGFGRELGKEGILEFTQSKQIAIDQTPGGKPLSSAWF